MLHGYYYPLYNLFCFVWKFRPGRSAWRSLLPFARDYICLFFFYAVS